MSLFPTTQRNKHLVQFNAGKCVKEGNLLKPDTRKGMVYMDQSDDQLMHFYWKERKAASAEDDFIIFPDEAELVRVNECTTGRVYVLKFKSSSQKIFYWMQSKQDDKDEELIRRVNQLINDPSGDADEYPAESDLMQMLNEGRDLDMNITQDNILDFIQNNGNLSQLNDSIISNTKWAELKSKLSESNESNQEVRVEGLTLELIEPILDDSDISSALFPFVTQSNNRSSEEIQQLIESEGFKKRLSLINSAIERGELDSILEELNSEKNIKSFLKSASDQAKLKKSRDNAMDEDE